MLDWPWTPPRSHLTGVLFTHWIADSLTLWKSPETQTDSRLWAAATYYAVLMHGVPQLTYVYGAVAALGGATILWSLRDGNAGNLMFDGGSICEFIWQSKPFSRAVR